MVLREIITTSRIRLSKYPLYVEPSPDIEKVAKNLGIPFHTKRYQDIFFTWQPPPAPWFKYNSDGSLFNDQEGFGAIIRDSQGHLIIGTMARVSLASINHLEILGVKSGALMCAQLNLNKVLFETDSTTIVCWLQGRGAAPWTSRRDLIETMDVLSCFEDWSISHTYREANAPADLMAARQIPMGSKTISAQDIWTELDEALHKDWIGILYQRKKANPEEANELYASTFASP
ncbi:hypothetical protein QJS04_geneDACA015181 [Acorus gramineus]|uniref:RNase H type-1 domain-containing protein n=1 Tax=Acorus gramineus TaxID=55184 RepID=A0AAV9B843_ACOGR|nr:hypothetical protein QJS04_geneDACA015181 [Acorus gramineus]